MPRLNNTPCRDKCCPNIATHRGYCEEHRNTEYLTNLDLTKAKYRGINPYSTQQWRNIRQQVISNHDGICRHCYQVGRIRPGAAVDHIVPVHKLKQNDLKSFYDINNLQYLCNECHDRKTAKERRS